MTDPRVQTVAKILVDYSVEVQANQLVRISGAPEGAPLILAVYLAISGTLGAAIFYLVAYWLRVEEIRSLHRRAVAWGQARIRPLR